MEKEIVLCMFCNAKGYHVIRELEDYHKGIYSHTKSVCGKCNGQGRLTKTTIITYDPYVEDEIE